MITTKRFDSLPYDLIPCNVCQSLWGSLWISWEPILCETLIEHFWLGCTLEQDQGREKWCSYFVKSTQQFATCNLETSQNVSMYIKDVHLTLLMFKYSPFFQTLEFLKSLYFFKFNSSCSFLTMFLYILNLHSLLGGMILELFNFLHSI